MKLKVKTRQSELNTWQDCPHLARLLRLGEVKDDRYSSDLVRGNVMHEVAETCGELLLEGQGALSLDDCLDLVDISFEKHSEQVDWWRATPEKTYEACKANVTKWREDILPSLHPIGIEQSFSKTIFEDDDLEVVLTGTADWVEEDRVIDWKNPGKVPSKAFPRKDWKLRRSDFQSHAYTWAFNIPEFTWFHFVDGEVEEITCTRGEPDWAAFKIVCEGFGRWVQSDMPSIPRWDTWRCGPVWCAAWSECRGKPLGDNPWGK